MAMIYIDHEIYLTILTGFHYLLTMECFVPYFGFISFSNNSLDLHFYNPNVYHTYHLNYHQ